MIKIEYNKIAFDTVVCVIGLKNVIFPRDYCNFFGGGGGEAGGGGVWSSYAMPAFVNIQLEQRPKSIQF